MIPSISIIIPTHDAADTIGQCLNVLFDQTVSCRRYEIIVVNDGSTDPTEEVAREYDVRVVTQPNQGRAAAKNAGIREANGELLLFIDADCEATRSWIEEVTAPFTDQEIVGVAGTLRTRQKGIVARFTQIEYEDKYEIMASSDYVDIVDTASAAYRRRVFEENGMFDTTLFTAEDTDFSFRLANKGYRMAFAPRATVFHQHPESISGYARRKWGYGYCRTVLYRRYPEKVIVDGRTPQSQKIQTGLFLLIGPALIGLVVSKRFFGVVLALLGLFLVSTLPFCIKVAKKDLGVALVSPLFLFVRAAAGGVGVAMGMVHQLLGKLKWNAPVSEH